MLHMGDLKAKSICVFMTLHYNHQENIRVRDKLRQLHPLTLRINIYIVANLLWHSDFVYWFLRSPKKKHLKLVALYKKNPIGTADIF